MTSDRLNRPSAPSDLITSSHQRATQSFLRVPRWKSVPCWNPLRTIVPPFSGTSMARPACSASLLSLACVSSRMRTAFVTLHPGDNFLLAKPPVLPYSVSWQRLARSFSQMAVYPRHRYLQQLGYFVDGEKLVVAVFFFTCGRVYCAIVELDVAGFHVFLAVSK